MLTQFIGIILVGVGAIFASLPLLIRIRFPIETMIWTRRGDAVIVEWDRARRVESKEGDEYYYLFKRKVEVKPYKLENLYLCQKNALLGKKYGNMLILYEADNGEYTPVKFNFSSAAKLDPIDDDMKIIYAYRLKKTLEKFQSSAWAKYAQIIIPVALLVGCGVMCYLILQGGTELASSLKEVAASLKASAEALKSAAGQAGEAAKAIPKAPPG